MNHTPTPWKSELQFIYDGNGVKIGVVLGMLPPEDSDQVAAFIIRAVNAHNDLKAACLAWAEAFEAGELEKYDAAFKMTKAAFVKAEGR